MCVYVCVIVYVYVQTDRGDLTRAHTLVFIPGSRPCLTISSHTFPPAYIWEGWTPRKTPSPCFSSPQVPVRFPWISLESIDPSQIRGNPTEPNWHCILIIFQTPDHRILPSYLVTTMMRYCIIMQGRDQDHTDDNDDDRLCKRSSRDDPEAKKIWLH